MSQTGYTLYVCSITQIKLYSFQYFFLYISFVQKKLFFEFVYKLNYRTTNEFKL